MKFNEEHFRELWRNATKEQRELAVEAVVEEEKHQLSNIDLAYRKAAVLLTGAALLAAGIANLSSDLRAAWPAAVATMVTIILTIFAILPKWSTVQPRRVQGLERLLTVTHKQSIEDRFVRKARHVYNMSIAARTKRQYIYLAGISLILGVFGLFLTL